MKTLLISLTVVALLIATWAYFVFRPESHVTMLMPSQPLRISNNVPIDIEIHAEYPVSVVGDGCRSIRTANDRFQCGPSEVVITDLRPALLVWGHSNRVNWIVYPSMETITYDTRPQPRAAVKPTSDLPPTFVARLQENPEPSENETQAVSGTYSFSDGQTATFSNRKFRKIHISSQFPLSVRVGDCVDVYTLNLECDGGPYNITIHDIGMSGTGTNAVEITATEF